MKKIPLISVLFLLSTISLASVNIILVRHGEKGEGSDPALTSKGRERAQALVNLARMFDISGVYSSDYQRTYLTGKPLADALKLTVNRSLSPVDYQGILNDIQAKHSGRTVLVVGHSNTIPGLVNYALGREVYRDIDESDFSKMFVLQIDTEKGSTAQVFSYRASGERLIVSP